MLGGRFTRRLGDTDCEAFHSGFFAQPANVTSSFAFLAVGGALLAWALRQPSGRRLLPIIYAGFVAANGFGGILFHGPAWTGSAWIHDMALAGSLVFIVLYDVEHGAPHDHGAAPRRRRRHPGRPRHGAGRRAAVRQRRSTRCSPPSCSAPSWWRRASATPTAGPARPTPS